MTTYEEKQVFKLWWTFIPIVIFSLLPILLSAEGKENISALIITGIVLLLIGWLLLSMKQVIRIDADGIHYKQRPFHRKFHTIPWSDIQNWKTIKINAFRDFGGWGIRITSKKKGYIMEGEYGLELQTGTKKLTVLSIKDKEAVEKVMEKQLAVAVGSKSLIFNRCFLYQIGRTKSRFYSIYNFLKKLKT